MISEKENTYASLKSGDWVNFMYSEESYGTMSLVLQRYSIDNETFSQPTGGVEHFNMNGTKVYCKRVSLLALTLMNYSGNGKYNIVYLDDTYDVEIMHETLLLDVDNDYVANFALLLTIDNNIGLYTYNSVDGLVKILDAGDENLHSLNFDGTNLYVINGSSALYKINLETSQSELVMNLSDHATDIQIINNWVYFGTYGEITLSRVNPVTNEIEDLN